MAIKKTPLINQYCDLKEKYKNCILFFRVGDFYEMFFDDAKKAAKTLNIALTTYSKNEDIPMCGIPYHACEAYINKLVGNGHKVALCEQTEDVNLRINQGQPLKRDVVRIITAGTVTESSMLDPKSYNFLLCCSPAVKGRVSYALLDLSVGDFFVDEINVESLCNVFSKWDPNECLLPDSLINNENVWSSISEWHSKVQLIPNIKYNLRDSVENLKSVYKMSTLDSLRISDLELLSAGLLTSYVIYTQKTSDLNFKPIRKVHNSDFLHLDKFTIENLEIVKTLQGSNKGTLFDTLDFTVTALGGRMLKARLLSPVSNASVIQNRLNSIEFFILHKEIIDQVRNLLSRVDDLERALGRVMLGRNSPIDLIKIADSLEIAEKIRIILSRYENIPTEILSTLGSLSLTQVYKKIQEVIVQDPPLKVVDGGFIRDGYNAELDSLRHTKKNLNDKITKLQMEYRVNTGVNALKIRYNNLLGYCIEIPITQRKKMTFSFTEKQVLSTIVRYGNDVLSEISLKVFEAQDVQIRKEIEIFEEVNKFVKSMNKSISELAHSIAIIDLTIGLAYKSVKNSYVKPQIDDTVEMHIRDGRNPIIEDILSKHSDKFTPNDCIFDNKKCMIMTGPNMAGKSTYLRQNALIVLMAQIGCYVPASYMKLGVVDGIFVRIGASDNLGKGMSTFMLEMTEIACILHYATQRSFIVVDEVGRGTSSKEGMAIASAIIHEISNKKIRSIFATHYHELVGIAERDDNLMCKTMYIKESGDELIFMHKVIDGSANESYALRVCMMAGISKNIIDHAKHILETEQ